MKKKLPQSAPSDICLILEGTYPYTMGGVSSWTHELIQMQSHLTFSIVALIGPTASTKLLYNLPENVVSVQTLRLQSLPQGHPTLPYGQQEALMASLEEPLLKLQSSQAKLSDLDAIIKAFSPWRDRLGQALLLDSRAAWKLLLRMYQATMPKTSFLDYFWSWRGLFGGLFSLLLADLPPAKAYHALCTGYAGLLLARAHLETGRPCAVTEHGIYTNERRIEIASADWLDDPHVFNLSVAAAQERELKDFWIDTFGSYSRLCYEACQQIITLYEGNQEFQRMDGADSAKLRVIPNGIDTERYKPAPRNERSPTIALIGRVVPIKDIKTYIKAVHILKNSLPNVRAYMLGPTDEDPQYAGECMELVEHLELMETLIFTGKVRIEDYLPLVDVIVLTSISEAQPLVILEAGAAGVPTVATDVGACREMILGASTEQPVLGAGGAVVPLSSPQAVANALLMLLTEKDYYQNCCRAIGERVQRYYNKKDQYRAYADLYGMLTGIKNESENKQAA
jgi:polysaccharide biosynthesis protein PelF